MSQLKTPFAISSTGLIVSNNGFIINDSFLTERSKKSIVKTLNKHKQLVNCLKDILQHDGGAYDLEPRQSKMIMEALKGLR